ncbi:DNA polymerase II large subunit [Candidatus Woesearchaeota archaeon]|nr:DNA polymerase II large subunit [Candidatus Woesearchaeota archaeon]
MEIIASQPLKDYFSQLQQQTKECYIAAEAARKLGLDPEPEVNIPLAKNMAERVVGLISVVAPQLVNTPLTQRIIEIEQQYGLLDWRVGFTIAVEVAQEKFCSFADKREAMEIGIRVGFAYLTLGIVSAPLEGFIGLKIKKRKDGKEYFALQYAGPIRGAGGTAASTSVILGDYVRIRMGYAPYDPTEQEVNRNTLEINDYHERVTNLQYRPSNEELKFLLSHLPVEVDGDPTERIEVLTYRDLPRIETNQIRGGMALVIAEGLSQKAPKLWKRLSKWGKDFGLEWDWLNDFIKLKEQIHAKHVKKGSDLPELGKTVTVKPNNTFLMDLVAGRPILTYPLAVGGFRLRYGRTRATGFSAAALHPATLILLDKYIAIGTQLKMERPGKAATITLCEALDGPIVRLDDGSVLRCKTEEQAKQVHRRVEEIIFLGDILFNYGDFSENGQLLVPAGYCPEWWALDVEKAISEKFSEFPDQPNSCALAAVFLDLQEADLHQYIYAPFSSLPSWEVTKKISEKLSVPLHPEYTYYWKLISKDDIINLILWLREGKIKKDKNKEKDKEKEEDKEEIQKIILPFFTTSEVHQLGKKVLEALGIPHEVIGKESIVLWKQEAEVLSFCFGFSHQEELSSLALPLKIQERSTEFKDGLSLINAISPISFRDKAGTFVGARMGRPEKAKMRAMTGSPQVMFPVGEEGDRLRSFQSASKAGKVNSIFPTLFCPSCKKETIYPRCEICSAETEKRYYCRDCGLCEKDTCRHGKGKPYKKQELNIAHYLTSALKMLSEPPPELMKGIRGTSNKNHFVEHLAKGILRAKHNIYVNKDGTTRYDATELPLTHFKPKEVKTSIEKLHVLGYTQDKDGASLISVDQILELKPQDIILPGFNSLDESAPRVLFRVAQFIDDLLVKFYKLPPFYNLKKEEDLIGHLVIGLAPHISAGLIGRIVGFSETQGLLAHPMYHAGLRRDCFHKDTFIPLCKKGAWEIKKIGEIVEKINPNKIVDQYGTKEKCVEGIKTIGMECNIVRVNNFTKHAPQSLVKIRTKLGRTLIVTSNHKQVIYEKRKPKVVLASQLKVKDALAIPYRLKIPKKDHTEINLFLALADQKWVMVRGVNTVCEGIKKEAKKYFSKREYDNYTSRDSYPIAFVKELYQRGIITDFSNLLLVAKRDTVVLPPIIPLTKEFLQIIGLYIAEGYSREVPGRLYQVYIAAENQEIRSFVQSNMSALFGLKITENKKDRLTYSSRILYHLFTSILKCGSSAYEKRIPPSFLNLPNEKLGYLLSGYFEGDGSVSSGTLRATFDTVSEGLLRDLDFVFGQMGIFVKNYTYTKLPGPKVREFYFKKGKPVPSFTITKGIIQSIFMKTFSQYIEFISSRKRGILQQLISSKKASAIAQEYTSKVMFDTIISVDTLSAEESYCLNVDGNTVVANSLLTRQCDGDEACVMLLMDALLNFSRQYLPEKRGAKTMDSPLVLTSILYPTEVDDQVHGLDVGWRYPLELYEAALQMKNPWEVKFGKEQKKIAQLGDRLHTLLQYEGFGYTHPTENINAGVQCSAYKILPSMQEKLFGQMEIARKVRAVDMDDVARLVIQRHFLRDIQGNLRKFSGQQFRCVKCNEKYRRPPLQGKCAVCGARLLFTITEGSVLKYLQPSLQLAEQYNFSPYLKQVLGILKAHTERVFGKEKEKQVGLKSFV